MAPLPSGTVSQTIKRECKTTIPLIITEVGPDKDIEIATGMQHVRP